MLDKEGEGRLAPRASVSCSYPHMGRSGPPSRSSDETTQILAALAVIIGGTLAATAPAQRGDAILVHRHRSGRRQHRARASSSTWPSTATSLKSSSAGGSRSRRPSSTSSRNAYLKALGEPGVLANGENKLGGMTFWVPCPPSNTVEGRQVVRAVVNPTANTRVHLGRRGPDRQGPALHQRRRRRPARRWPTSPAPRTCPAGQRLLDADRAPRRSSSRSAPVGTLGSVKVADQWRRATDTRRAPMDTVIGGTDATRTSTR